MNELSLNSSDAPTIMARLVEQFCAMPVDFSDIPVMPEKLNVETIERLEKAVKLADTGDLSSAYSQAVTGMEYTCFEYDYLIGKILFACKLYYESARSFDKALLKFADYGEIWFHMGMANYQMGLFASAFADWAESARVNENHEDAKLMMSLATAIAQGQPHLDPEISAMTPIVHGRGIDIIHGGARTHPDAIGVGIAPEGKKNVAGKQQPDFLTTSYADLSMFSDGQFDYLIARHHLARCVDPVKALLEWARVIKPGAPIGLVLPDEDAEHTVNMDPARTHLFTMSSLRNMVSLIPQLAIVEEGICVNGRSFYAILEKVPPGAKPSFPYRRKRNKLMTDELVNDVTNRASIAEQAGINEVARAAYKKLAELDPQTPLPTDPDKLYPAPFPIEEPTTVNVGKGLKIAVLYDPLTEPGWRRELERMGHTVYLVPSGQREKPGFVFEKYLRDIRPDFVASVNYNPQMAETLAHMNIPYVCWALYITIHDIDWQYDYRADNTFIFHCPRMEVERRQRLGATNVYYLPPPADTQRYSPSDENPQYACDVSFVDDTAEENGYAGLLKRLKARLMNADFPTEDKNGIFRWVRLFGKIIEQQTSSFTQLRIPELWDGITGSAQPPDFAELSRPEILYLLGEQADAKNMAQVVNALADIGINLWGADKWKACLKPGAVYRGAVDNPATAARIYSTSKVNINVTSVNDQDACTRKVFEVLACRGFLLTDQRDAYDDCYTAGKDYITYKTPAEALELARYYIEHDDERTAIAENGYRKTLERHTVRARWAEILEQLGKVGVIDPAVLKGHDETVS